MAGSPSYKQINVRVEPALYRALESIARQERRFVPELVRLLLEEGLRQRTGGWSFSDDTSGLDSASLAAAGGAFDWLAEEQDLYDSTCGEPL